MQIRKVTNTATEVSIPGREILFSYQTPVAVKVHSCEERVFATESYYSKTTSRDISAWTSNPEFVPQKTIDALAETCDDHGVCLYGDKGVCTVCDREED